MYLGLEIVLLVVTETDLASFLISSPRGGGCGLRLESFSLSYKKLTEVRNIFICG